MRNAVAAYILTIVLPLTIFTQQQSTEFTYQGRLTDLGTAPTASYQMEFRLFDALVNGTQVGPTITNTAVQVTSGIFSVRLDFGSLPFGGPDRYLQVAVRRTGSDPFTDLVPRQKIGSSPYATKSKSADEAGNAVMLDGQPASEYVTNTSLDGSVIRNQLAQQPNANLNISGNGFFGGNVGIGTTSPPFKLSVFTSGHGITQTDGSVTVGSFISSAGGWLGTRSNHPLHFFSNNSAPYMTVATNGFVGIGTHTPAAGLDLKGAGQSAQQRITDNLSGNSLVLQGGSGENLKVTGFNFGSGFAVPLYLSVDGANTILHSGGGNVGIGIGNTNPQARLHVTANSTGHGAIFENLSGRSALFGSGITVNGSSSSFAGDLFVGGFGNPRNLSVAGDGLFNRISTFLVTGGAIDVCWNQGFLATCSSSLRYKTDVEDFRSGLEIIRLLRPISFTWKDEKKRDLGFAAEEVAEIEPLFTFRNDVNQIEGVKYSQLSVLFVNAFKEQQAQIEKQQAQIDRLTIMLCSLLGDAHEICAQK
jgi:hypothetical protein